MYDTFTLGYTHTSYPITLNLKKNQIICLKLTFLEDPDCSVCSNVTFVIFNIMSAEMLPRLPAC